jgi:hypothetical protein
MKNSTYTRRRKTVSTVKKSHAMIPAAWWRRNDRQFAAPRRGAGPRPWARRILRIELADTPPAKTQQLAVDALVAPPRVLAGKPHDQLLHLVGDRRAAVGGRRVGPAPTDHAPVPAQQGLRPHQEHRPTRPREQTAQRREQRTVFRLQAGPWMLAAQHHKLVAQHQDLDLLGLADRKQSVTSSRLRRSAS